LIASRNECERSMFDIVLVLSGLSFFALSIGYAAICGRL
jgi:hypothetical protein